jgi:hypothetical protein
VDLVVEQWLMEVQALLVEPLLQLDKDLKVETLPQLQLALQVVEVLVLQQ